MRNPSMKSRLTTGQKRGLEMMASKVQNRRQVLGQSDRAYLLTLLHGASVVEARRINFLFEISKQRQAQQRT